MKDVYQASAMQAWLADDTCGIDLEAGGWGGRGAGQAVDMGGPTCKEKLCMSSHVKCTDAPASAATFLAYPSICGTLSMALAVDCVLS